MDEGKRKLLKALPMVALAPVFMARVGQHEAAAHEIKAGKRYIFMLPADADLNQKELTTFNERLRARGVNATVIQGDVEIYELD